MTPALETAFRESGACVRAALAGRLRDLDLTEEAWAEACARAAAVWGRATPDDPAAWLYRVGLRAALDAMRRRGVRARYGAGGPEAAEADEDSMLDAALIPDDRLRLIFICCHPAVAPEARAALTLQLVCGLSAGEIARAFLVPEPTMAQRLVRAKAKIRQAGVPFGLPRPEDWGERLDAVLSTLEVAYTQAHAEADAAGPHARHGPEMLALARMLVELLPDEPDVLGLAATLGFAEARRPARVGAEGAMVPLSEQDPARWNGGLMAQAHGWLARGERLGPARPRVAQAALGAAWAARPSLAAPPPWAAVLGAYDRLLAVRDDPVIRLNRAVALAEVESVAVALAEVQSLGAAGMEAFAPYHAVRADLLRRAGRRGEARDAYDRVLACGVGAAEARWIGKQRREMEDG